MTKKITLKPVDATPFHMDLFDEVAKFLCGLPATAKAFRGVAAGPQAVKLICLVSDVLDRHGLKIMEMSDDDNSTI